MSWQATKRGSSEDVSPISPQTSHEQFESSKDAKKKGSVTVLSTWRIGWQTPTLMISCYILALIFAIAHLILFKYIHGHEASGPTAVIPQSYVTTLSTILSNGFGFSLRAALAVAFCQYMWHLLRVTTMKVSTIELLFTIRTNIFMLFRTAVVRSAPILCVLAMFMWALNVATSFPPGAITVTTAERVTYEIVTVPTFNASFMGNSSGLEANKYSLANLFPADVGGGFSVIKGLQGTKHRSLLPRLAFPVLVKGEALPVASPCGLNCTYTTVFEGPSFECTSSTSTFRNASDLSLWEIYRGDFFDHRDGFFAPSLNATGPYSVSHFNSTTMTPLEKNMTGGEVLIRKSDLMCLPGRSRFEVTNTWMNNIQSRSVKAERIDRLINLQPRTRGGMVIVPGFSSKAGYGYGTEAAQWNEYALNFYRDINHITIIASMLSRLVGNVLASSVVQNEINLIDVDNIPVTPAGGFPAGSQSKGIETDVVWGQREFRSQSGDCPGINVSIIDSTRFNRNFNHFASRLPANPDIVVTETLLNEHLFNLTVSMMSAFGTWTTPTNATKYHTINVYNFSSPLNLLLPYFISLFVALPFLGLGLWALWKNGVSAIDSSFLQILTTTTGSAALDRAAAGGCLGGEESVPEELKDLKIRFGEILDRNEPGRVKRAAFGIEGEITSLIKGDKYGISKWI